VLKETYVQALKHYFLIDRGDLLLSFLDSAEAEMAKPQQHVSLPRLQTLLDLGELLILEIGAANAICCEDSTASAKAPPMGRDDFISGKSSHCSECNLMPHR